MTSVHDLVAWLTQVWDEQEKEARSVGAPDGFYPEPYDPGSAMHHDAVLARIAADRQILALHHPARPADAWYWLERECKECGHRWHADPSGGTLPTVIGPETGCPTVRLLALPYADRPGYQEAWRP